MGRPSGPKARDLPPFRMAFLTACVVNGDMFVSRGCCLRNCRITLRVAGSDLWGTGEVNCLLKAEAIAR